MLDRSVPQRAVAPEMLAPEPACHGSFIPALQMRHAVRVRFCNEIDSSRAALPARWRMSTVTTKKGLLVVEETAGL